MRLRIGAWRFSPTLWPTLAALFFFVLTFWLGNWQSERAQSKRALQARYDMALTQPPLHMGIALLALEDVLYHRVEVEGEFDPANAILLDNRVYNGTAGYHVLTPLKIAGSSLSVLVNRGWVAPGPLRANPPVPVTPVGRVKLEGIAIDPHSRYFELMKTVPQGRVWQNLDFEQYAMSTGLKLQPVVLLQTSTLPDGLLRAWPRPDAGVTMHVSYAFQWYSLAVTLVVLWLAMNVKRHRVDGV